MPGATRNKNEQGEGTGMASKIVRWLLPQGFWPKLRRAVQLLLLICLLVLAAATFLIGTSPGRHTLLEIALPRVQETIPGELSLGEVRWPSLGRLELRDILWRSPRGDTLLVLAEGGLVLDLKGLRHRDLFFDRAWATGLEADVPALQNLLASASLPDTVAQQAPPKGNGFSFPRPGAMTGIPSVGIGDFALTAASIRLAQEQHLAISQLKVTVDLRAERPTRVAAAWRVWPLPELAFTGHLQAAIDDSLRVQLTPLRLSVPETREPPPAAEVPLTGQVVVSLAELMGGTALPAVRLEGVTLTGDFGDLWLDGELSRGGGGKVRLRARRPANRVHLLHALSRLFEDGAPVVSLADTLWSHWPSRQEPDVDVLCILAPSSPDMPFKPRHLELAGRFVLPGPRDLQPLLPSHLRVDDLDFLRGRLTAAIDLSGATPAYRGELDLGETSWLQTAYVAVQGAAGRTILDSLRVQLPGLAVAAQGSLVGTELDLTTRLDIPDTSLISRWQDEVIAGLVGNLHLQARVKGPVSRPDLDLQFHAAGGNTQVILPVLDGHIRTHADEVDLSLDGPQGLIVDRLSLTSFRVTYRGSLPDSSRHLAGRFSITAADSSHTLATRGHLQIAQAYELQVDSLVSTWRQQRLALQQPCRLSLNPATRQLYVSDLDIVGDPGHIRAEGMVHPDSLDLSCELDLQLVAASLPEYLPVSLPALSADDTLQLSGGLRLLGTATAPAARLAFRASILGSKRSRALNLATTFWVLPDSHSHSRSERDGIPDTSNLLTILAPPAGAQQPGLTAHLQVSHQDSMLLAGQVRHPARIALFPFGWEPTGNEETLLEIHSATVNLTELAAYLPPGAGPAGTLRLQGNARVGSDVSRLVIPRRVQDAAPEARAIADPPADKLDVSLGWAVRLTDNSWQRWVSNSLPTLAPEDTVVLDGDLRLLGRATAPAAHLDLQAGLPGHKQYGALALGIMAWLLPATAAGDDAADTGTLPADLMPPSGSRFPGLACRLNLTQRDSLLLRGEAHYPLRVALLPPRGEIPAGERGSLTIESRTIRLAELSPYLPPGLNLGGECRLDASARGTLENLEIAGQLAAPRIEARSEDGSWVSAKANLELRGTLQAPDVDGAIQVSGGLIHLPEVPPNLLPVEGDALLWQAAADSTGQSPVAATGLETGLPPARKPAGSHAPVTPSLAVGLKCPGNLWLRGHGLDLELTGDLQVGLKNGLPVAVGRLEALQGTLRFMGRVFNIERGKVTFYGDEVSLNPELDLSLITNVEKYRIRIQILGTAKQPELVLASEPYLSDGDIFSVLLFGKPLFDLDSGQQGLLASRAGDVLAMYGAVKLQDSLSKQFGVDIITYGQGADPESQSSLIVGKYLSPKVLMKYEKVLDKESAYFVHLNYTLDRNFKIETTYSQGGKSGVAVKWHKDY